jgi:hypothetical protein
VVLDLALGDGSGLDLLDRLRAADGLARGPIPTCRSEHAFGALVGYTTVVLLKVSGLLGVSLHRWPGLETTGPWPAGRPRPAIVTRDRRAVARGRGSCS